LRLHLEALRQLLDQNSFWACGRSRRQLVRMLHGSTAVVSVWKGGSLIGFGRATSDGVYRAVLWDVVVAGDWQSRGLGRRIVTALLQSPGVREAERVYLMTTNSGGFYRRLGFHDSHGQLLLVHSREKQEPVPPAA
jgi:N-acetylglutamate synthase-like GNAT family acetyltransferase